MTRFIAVVVCTALALTGADSASADSVFSLEQPRRFESTPGLTAVAAMPDGSFVYSDAFKRRVVRVMPDGTRRLLTRASLSEPGDLLVRGDGSVLIADYQGGIGFVRRVAPDGTVTTVAGGKSESPDPDIGDFGPATEASLGRVGGLASAPGGGFVLTGLARIRHVAPDGIITTIAGTGNPNDYSGEGGPARAASLPNPTGIAAQPDGGYLVALRDRVVSIDAAGSIRTVAGSGAFGFSGDGGSALNAGLSNPSSVAITPGGGFLIADALNGRIRHVTAAGLINTAAGNGATSVFQASLAGFFRGEGRRPEHATLPRPVDIAIDPLGGWLIADTVQVSLLSVSGGRRMGVAVTSGAVPGTGLHYTATAPGVATLEIRRGHRTVATRTATTAAGRNSIRVPRVEPGFYVLRLRAQGESGVDTDRLGVLLGGRLRFAVGADIIGGQPQFQDARHQGGPGPEAGDAAPYDVGRCRSMARNRVDCEIEAEGACAYVFSLQLRRTGLVYERDYECERPRFRRHPASLSEPSAIPLF